MISLLSLSCFLYLIIGFKLFLHTPTPELSSRPRWLISHSTGLELLPSQRHGDGHSRLGVPGHRRGLLIFCYWWCWPFCYSFRALFPAFGVSSAGPADRRPVKELSVSHSFVFYFFRTRQVWVDKFSFDPRTWWSWPDTRVLALSSKQSRLACPN